MISRSGKENFLAAHYDWLIAGVGVLALVAAAAFFAMTLGDDPDELASEEVRKIERIQRGDGVKAVDMTEFQSAVNITRAPLVLKEMDDKKPSFLASERRVKCKCGKVISGDVKRFPKCPFCGEKQEEDQMLVLDTDGDGMSDEFEELHGFNKNDPSDGAADADNDGFTNYEEFVAKTNPKDPADHPDYLDSISVLLPLKETCVPFAFRKATEVPGKNYRCEFFAPDRKKNKFQTGILSAKIGEKIVDPADPKFDSGYVLEGYEQKSEKRAVKGGMPKTFDISEAKVKRVSDGKVVTLVIARGKDPKLTPVDIQATLAYARGTVQNFDVVPGSPLVLNGEKYTVTAVEAAGKGAKVTIQHNASQKKRVIEALAN